MTSLSERFRAARNAHAAYHAARDEGKPMTYDAARDYFAALAAADDGRRAARRHAVGTAYYYATLVADIDAAIDARDARERDEALDPDRLREENPAIGEGDCSVVSRRSSR